MVRKKPPSTQGPKFLNRKVQRRLFLMDDYGKLTHFPNYEFFVIFFLFFLFLSIAANALLFFQNRHCERKSGNLRAAVAHSEQTVKELRRENEFLAARLVVAGVNPEEARKITGENQTDFFSEPNEDSSSEKTDSNVGIIKERPQTNKTMLKEHVAGKEDAVEKILENNEFPSEMEYPVSSSNWAMLDDFKSAYDKIEKKLDIQFKLSNVSEDKISGFIFVLLKNPEKNPETWMALPESPLKNGKPSDYKSGRFFEIRSFKTIRFTAGKIKNTDLFIVAEIFIFGSDGRLLVKNDFSLKS
jgi:hypothetical protein